MLLGKREMHCNVCERSIDPVSCNKLRTTSIHRVTVFLLWILCKKRPQIVSGLSNSKTKGDIILSGSATQFFIDVETAEL